MVEYICPSCENVCQVLPIDDSFDYSGTHCSNGRSGTHHVEIYYVSDCCESEIEDYKLEDCRDYDDRDLDE